MKSAVIIYASFGEGHKRAAQAIGEHFSVPVCDLLDFTHPWVRYAYREGYRFITQRLPTLWRLIFLITRIAFVSGTAHYFQKFLLRRFFSYIIAADPDIVITTHFSASRIVAMARRNIKSRIVAVVTDIRAHSLWADKAVERYFVFSEITKQDLARAGINRDIISSGYVAVREGFLQEEDNQLLRLKLGLSPRHTLLFVSSDIGHFPYLISVLPRLLDSFNVIVIYGRNKKLKKYLENLNSENLKCFSFYESMWELVSISSIIIGKPGGLTIFEGVVKKKFFIFTHFIPGQESENMVFLDKQGIARYVKNKKDFIDAIGYFCNRLNQDRTQYPIEVTDICQPLSEILNPV